MSMTPDEKINVIIAARDGKTIQRKFTAAGRVVADAFRNSSSEIQDRLVSTGAAFMGSSFGLENWQDYLWNPGFDFNFTNYDYRIKPEPPKPREFWLRLDCPIGGDQICKAPIVSCSPGECQVIHVREVTPEQTAE